MECRICGTESITPVCAACTNEIHIVDGKRVCRICGHPHEAKGLCGPHYNKMRMRTDPEYRRKRKAAQYARHKHKLKTDPGYAEKCRRYRLDYQRNNACKIEERNRIRWAERVAELSQKLGFSPETTNALVGGGKGITQRLNKLMKEGPGCKV